MLSTLVLTLCLNGQCLDRTPFERMPAFMCALQGQQLAADWIRQNAPDQTLERYRCVFGTPRRAV